MIGLATRKAFWLAFLGVVGGFLAIWMIVQAAENSASERAATPETPAASPDPLIARTVDTLQRNEAYWADHPEPMTPRAWLAEFSEIEAASVSARTLAGEDLTHISVRAARLAGAASRLDPKPRSDVAPINCAMAASALRSYIDDAAKGAAFTAEDDMRDLAEWKPKCLATMGGKAPSTRR